MTDTNPENKIDDCPTPVDWVVITPHSHTSRNKVNQTHSSETRDAKSSYKAPPPPSWSFALNNATDLLRYPVEVSFVEN